MQSRIRLATEADAEEMLEIYAPVVLNTVISFETVPPSAEEFRGRIRAVLESQPWLVCEIGGNIAGYSYSSPFKTRAGYRWTTETTIYVHPEYHRRGVGRALYTALLACLEAMGYHIALAVIALPNDASVGLHEAMGFQRTGTLERIGYKLGRWVDDGIWQREIQPAVDAPPQPIALRDLLGTPAWQKVLESGAAQLRA